MSDAIDASERPSAAEAQPPLPPTEVLVPLSAKERGTIALVSLLQSGVFGWAYVLPWDKFTLFAVLSFGLSAAHALLCITTLVPSLRRFQQHVWRLTSTLAMLVFAWGTWAVFSSSWYISRLYGGLGQGLSAALVAIWALLLLVTVPMAAWGLVRTRGYSFRLPLKATLGGLALTSLLGATPPLTQERASDGTAPEWTALVQTNIAPLVKSLPKIPADVIEWSPTTAKRHASCDDAPDESRQTALAFFRDRGAKLTVRCWQATSLRELSEKVAAGLTELAASDLIVLDRITSYREIRTHSPLLDPLMLRPGVDGGCIGGKCLAPWQLIAQSSFTTHAPLAFLADLKFGLSIDALRKQLVRKKDIDDALFGISTQSVSISSDGSVVALSRLRPVEVPVDALTVTQAAGRYSAHIVAAQQPNGQFRYTLDPFSGEADVRNFSIPRQAGTLLVLCELGEKTPEVEQAIRLGLQLLSKQRRTRGEQWALSLDKRSKLVRLGDSALPLVAFTTCRERVGPEFDDAIKGLAQFILAQQLADGSFASTYDWKKERRLGGAEALYGPGQALLGLTLLDGIVLTAVQSPPNESQPLGNHDTLSRAIQSGMDHVAHQHWNMAMYPFFFVEENWNCLTARAALAHQRNDAYEQFCIDYMRFKSRLIFDESSGVAADFLGGFGFGNVIPPHNTGAAGFGEAMAALLAVKKARQEDTSQEETRLKSVLAFLLRQQWTPETCFGCAPHVVGSMSEHMHSPITRIDFTQHAWGAVGHGARVLGVDAP